MPMKKNVRSAIAFSEQGTGASPVDWLPSDALEAGS